MDRNRSGRRLSSCSDCRAKRSKCSHQISPAEDQGMPLAPEHALRSPPAHRTSAAFAVGFSPPLCQTQAMQPPHNQANKRAHSSIVASNVQQVYLTPFLECNTPGGRDVVPRDLPSSGMIAPAKLPQLYGDHDAYGEVRGCPPKRCEGNRGQRRWQRRRINRAVH